ncbi:MAG TPA: class I SAM-dependent methyltransferase [Candidatus Brocadiaceae bacterium]|nr:MAG: hypothetical protein A2Y09_07905 [Planctomycetes bacterium GWA2_39_15]
MDRKSLEDNFFFEQFYWWFLGRRRILRNLIRKFFKGTRQSIALDVGCGTGIILNDLQEYAIPVGIDPSKIALDFTKRRGHKNLFCGDVCRLPLKSETFDLIIIMGVLYHKGVESDEAAIRELYRVLKKGGVVIIDEAAYNYLQSKHNLAVGGIRRYTRSQLVNKCKKCNLEILKSSYWNVLMLPLYYLIVKLENHPFTKKKYSKLIKLPNFINNILKTYLYAEAFLLKYVNFPIGPSIVVVAKKK